MFNMDINVGTVNAVPMTIDLDQYCERKIVEADKENVENALRLLSNVLNERSLFANTGNRNYGAVNGCIALHVLGYDPVAWFNGFFVDPEINKLFHSIDMDLFMEHVERVDDYLDRWGPKGLEYKALDYAL